MKKLITILMMAFAVIVVSCSNEDITGTGKKGGTPPDVIKGKSIITTIPQDYTDSGKVLKTVISADGKTVTVSVESATRNVITGEYVLELSEGNHLLYKHKTADAYVAFTLVNNKLQVVNNTFAGITDANKNDIKWDISTESTYIPDADINAALASIEEEQFGGVAGFTKYYKTFIDYDPEGAIDIDVSSLYLNANKNIAKMAEIMIYDGKIEIWDGKVGTFKDFDNEIVIETALQYTVTDISPAKVVQKSVEVNYKTKGYKLYEMKTTKEEEKVSIRIYSGGLIGTGKWETTSSSELQTEYYLMKEVGDKLYNIRVNFNDNNTPSDPSDDEYSIDAEVNLDSPREYDIYTKL